MSPSRRGGQTCVLSVMAGKDAEKDYLVIN